MKISNTLPKLALAALFATGAATAVVANEAANPAATGSAPGILASTSQAADAQGYRVWHRGYYSYNNRYWAHRRWHPAYYGAGHRWTPGFYIYF